MDLEPGSVNTFWADVSTDFIGSSSVACGGDRRLGAWSRSVSVAVVDLFRVLGQCGGHFAAGGDSRTAYGPSSGSALSARASSPRTSPRRVFCSAECRLTARTGKDRLQQRSCPVCAGSFEAAARSTARPPAARTPNGNAAGAGTRTGPAASARNRPRGRWPNSRRFGPHPAGSPVSGTRWSPPRPATVRTATSRSPWSRPRTTRPRWTWTRS